MPWWLWIIAGLFLLVAIAITAMRSFRRRVRKQFIEYLREAYPQFEVVGESAAKLDLSTKGGARSELYLHKLYNAAAADKSADAQARTPLFEEFAAAVLVDPAEITRALDPAADAARVMPRLVTAEFVAALARAGLPHRPLGDTGLSVAYVLDSPRRVMYLTRQHANELQVADDEALHQLALSNLRKVSSARTVRDAIEQPRQLVVVKSMDTYDAARLLLVPEHLHGGEALMAGVPDRDTLALVRLPREQARRLPMTPDNTDHLLLNKPLWVTRDGIELA